MTVMTMKIGDLIDMYFMGIGAVVDVWHDDEDGYERASVWLVAQERHIFINTHEWGAINANR